MAGDTVITLVGNLVDDPELRFTPSGAAVAKFRIASTPRTFDRQTNEWKDGESLFLTCNVWRQPAENCAETLQRGMRVIVQGRLRQRTYDTKEGEKRTVYEVEVDEVGPSLLRATAKVTKAQRTGGQGAPGGGFGGNAGGGGGGGFGGGGQQGGNGGGWGSQNSGGGQSAPSDDPWASSAPASGGQQGGGQQSGNGGGWGSPAGGGFSDEPPF
ncbi:single-stranded DNA-binding protein [Streptacidiphilus sp. PAMC 29251]